MTKLEKLYSIIENSREVVQRGQVSVSFYQTKNPYK
jgi:hypothetical protein